jgi:5-methyltetrahydropteroyltriglutamate--homocysteine methyltransferase
VGEGGEGFGGKGGLMQPPFRADQVGSLLRPFAKEKSLEERREAIRDVVARQEAVGLQAVTDGEFSRDWWHLDFLSRLEGVSLKALSGPGFGGTGEQPPIPIVTGKVRYSSPVMIEDFSFLKSLTTKTAKFCIPSPSMLHMRPGRAGISREAYPDLDEFFADAARAYQAAIAAFAAAGCTYLQLDDTSFAYLCDAKMREAARRNGDDPAALPLLYARTIQKAIEKRPSAMTVTMHTCRGNFMSSWVAEGGYEPVAEAMFSSGVDGYFMEFDTERAGGFEPLRYAPKGKKIVLGLVSSKVAEMESKDSLKRRIDQAARFVPLENLCLSPQCGFSSTHHGNKLSHDDQWRKLALVVDTAREVWT